MKKKLAELIITPRIFVMYVLFVKIVHIYKLMFVELRILVKEKTTMAIL
jgi:hypothetical protein